MRLHVVVAAWTLQRTPSGAARRTECLLRELAPMLGPGESVTVLHGRGVPPAEPPAGIRYLPADLPPRPAWRRALAERLRLRPLLDSLGANVLELGTLPVPRGLPPVSLTVHDVRDLDGWRKRPAILYRRALMTALRRVAHVTVPSEFTAERLRRAAGGLLPPLSVVHNGVDVAAFQSAPPAREGRPYFLHVGHLERRKNLLLLLSAYSSMLEAAARDPSRLPALYLVGADHGERAALEERAALLDLSAHVHFLGVVDDERLRALYRGASAVLVPSLHEGFGLTALEGLAAGRPVLVSDRGALPEVVDDAGSVLPADDAAAWARAMAETVDRVDGAESERSRYRRAGKLSWRPAAAAMLEVWRGIARAQG